MKDIFLNGKAPVTYPTAENFRFIIQKGAYTIEDHWHTCIEILLPFSGSYDVSVQQQHFHLEKGDILFLHSGTVHSLSAKNRGTRLILQFDIELLYAHREFQTLLFSMPPCIHLKRKTSASTYRKSLSLLLFMLQEYRHQHILWASSLYASALELYVMLLRAPEIQMQTFSAKKNGYQIRNVRLQEKFLAVCRYLNQNLTSSITLENAAAYAGFSKFHFSRLFQQYMGTSFSEYRSRQRIQKAKVLLLTTDASITDIAMESGFNSSSTFNRTFYNSENMSPSDFRKFYAKLQN
mgnify:FL=1